MLTLGGLIALAPLALVGALAVAVILWSVWGLRRPEVRARVRFRRIGAIALVEFLVLFALVDLGGSFLLTNGYTVTGLMSSQRTPSDPGEFAAWLVGVWLGFAPAGIILGGVVAASSAIGYLAFARLGPPRKPGSGAAVGPVALIVCVVAVQMLSPLLMMAQQAGIDQAAAARTAFLHVSTSRVHATAAGPSAPIEQVSLHVALRVDRDLDLAPPGKLPNPRFALGPEYGMAFDAVTSGSLPTHLVAGATYDVDLVVQTTLPAGRSSGIRLADAIAPVLAGKWILRTDIEDTEYKSYSVEVSLDVAPDAASG